MRQTALLLFFLTSFCWAVPESQLEADFTSRILPFYETAESAKLGSLHYNVLRREGHQKILVILPGRSEPIMKYAELMYDLKEEGFDFYLLDHQGQGRSDRLLRYPHKGYVRHFQNYVKDLDRWMKEVVLPHAQGKDLYLLAHSMGGAVAAHYMSQNPALFKKAVFSAPMMEINTKPYSEKIARLLSGLLCKLGQGANYAPDRGPYIPENDTFEANEVTHSEARFNVSKFLFVHHPELVVAGPTNRWVNESLKATRFIDRLAPKIQTPILMFQSGQDLIVRPSRQNRFCEQSESCQLIKFPEAHHEILMEKDPVRNEALSLILNFFQG